MIKVKSFVFSDFSENTYVLYDETKECIIIDPGCYRQPEKDTLADFIEQEGLKPVRLVLTHAHLDHVFGNKFVFDKYGLLPEMHEGELIVLQAAPMVGAQYGVPVEPSPEPKKFLTIEDKITFGNSSLDILFTPGHSPASLSFYSEAGNFVIAGDTLFENSIGRTDLPGGDLATLLKSIREQLLPLGDEVVVYSGHGPSTTLGQEAKFNPFLNGYV